MFRRRTTSEQPVASDAVHSPSGANRDKKGYTPKKGAPTPKRRESESQRQKMINAPKTWRESLRQNREQQRRESARRREAYARGDERYMRPQDQGKVRAYARDFVDTRRMVSEFFLYFSLVIILLLFLPVPEVQLAVTYVVWPAMMITIILEGVWVSRKVKRRARELYPGESVRGAGWYATMRMLQIRRLRLPKPRHRPGDDPESHHR